MSKAIYPLLIVFFCLFSQALNAKIKTHKSVDNQCFVNENATHILGDTSAIIAKIRAQYQRIKTDSAKDKHQRLEAECDGLFGDIEFQSQNGKIRMISYTSGSDHGAVTEEYYFQNDSLFFLFVSEGGWMFDSENTDSENPKTIDEITETRYYFHNNQIIRAIRKHAKEPTEKVLDVLAKAKNENLKGEKAGEWLKKAKELKAVSKANNLNAYMCK